VPEEREVRVQVSTKTGTLYTQWRQRKVLLWVKQQPAALPILRKFATSIV